MTFLVSSTSDHVKSIGLDFGKHKNTSKAMNIRAPSPWLLACVNHLLILGTYSTRTRDVEGSD